MKEKKSAVVEDMRYSAISGMPTEATHHLIFGRGYRDLAEEDRLILPLTDSEHNMSPHGLTSQIHENHMAEVLSKMLGQMAFEKAYLAKKYAEVQEANDTDKVAEKVSHEAREAFMRRYGRSWL